MLHTVLKSLLAHKVRLFATALAVTLGVALMSGTLVLTDTMNRTFNNLFADVYQGTDAVVRAKAAFEGPQGSGLQRGRVDAALVSRVQSVPGVATAEGSIFGYARITAKDGQVLGNPVNGAPTLGTNWSVDQSINPFRLVAGSAPQAPDDVVIDRKSARDGHLQVGDSTVILVLGPPQRMRISGIATFGTADSPGGASCAIFTSATAQRLITAPGKFDSISVVAAPHVSDEQLVQRIRPALPAGTEAVTGKAITKESQDQIAKALSFFSTFLLIFAVIALLVGGFMMFNTFAITVAQRTRENGLLRALGASRRQVLGSVLAEALGVGVIASLLGVGAGIVVAIGLKSLMSAVGIEIPAAGVTIRWQSMLIAFCIGLIVTVLSAISPARKAAKVSPIAAMQLGVAGSTGYGSKQRVYVGIAVSAGGIGTLMLGLFSDVSRRVQIIGLGAVLVFFGISILGRTIALPLSRAIGWPLARAGGVTGELARENAMRNPKRTAASASALMIGVGVVGLITIFVASIRASVDHSINSTFTGDVVVDSGGGLAGGVDPAIAKRLDALPEVDVAAGLRAGVARIGGSGVIVSASEPDKLLKVMDIQAASGSASELGTDGLAVFSKVASDHKWRVGSTVDAAFAKTGQQRMRIALIYRDNTQLGNYFMTTAAYEANFASQFDHEVFVKITPGTSTASAVGAIEGVTHDYPGVKVLTRSEYVQNQMKPLDQLLALVYALLGLAIIIALLGIANTLTLSISERIREIGLLRAVGMTRGQLRSMIRWESVIIALQGTFLGLLIGIFFGWALVRALHDQGITELAIPATSLGVIVVAACIAGMLAAITPGRRAARLDLLRAVESE